MTERQCKVGDELWIRVTVAYEQTHLHQGDLRYYVTNEQWDRNMPALPKDLRTADDFKDEYDQAIIDAAVALVRRIKDEFEDMASMWPETNTLKDAVQAKLDADKPQTARERLQGVIFRNLPTNPRDPIEMPNVVAMLDEAERLGLLNEPES